MGAFGAITETIRPRPRVVVLGLASCFGCQLQITNDEPHLMEVLDQIDLEYWSLVSSETMPETYDLVIVEGSVTTQEHVDLLKRLRGMASHVMAIGACANTGGVTGMAENGLFERVEQVYPEALPEACGEIITPRPVSDVIEVDSRVTCCPIDSHDFVEKLQQVLFGSNAAALERTLCSDCKRHENDCVFNQGVLCMGLVTRSGCGTRCVNLGRPCFGCGGLSPAANIEASRYACEQYGVPVERFDKALQMFSQVHLAKAAAIDAAEAAGGIDEDCEEVR